MACTINCKKVLLGGFAAGIFTNFCDFIGHGVILMPRYNALMQMGYYFKEPAVPFLPLNIFMNFTMCILAVWIYAACRDTLGPGPKTALKVGLILGIMITLPSTLVSIAWSPIGKFVPVVSAATCLVEATFGTLIGAFFYKPKN